MVEHLLAAGYSVTLYSRTQAKALSLLDRGARWEASPRAVTEHADVVCTMVGYPSDVREVYFGPNGIFQAARPGMTLIDFTTTEPTLAREIASAANDREATALDAPVSGGDVGARDATLSIMTGGPLEVCEAMKPLFELLGKNIRYQGPAGSGQHAKMCNQIVIAGTMIGVCESLLYGIRTGLDMDELLAAISGGAAGCWTLNQLAPRILQDNFEPGFLVEHFIKDMGIALAEAERMGLALPGLALVRQLYLAVQAQGFGRKGTHALFLALRNLSGRDR